MIILLSLGFLVANTSHSADIQVTLGWDANTEADLAKYEIWQAEVLGSQSGPWSNVGEATTNQIILTVDDAKNWQWMVYAIDTSGNRSMPSNTESLRDETPPKDVTNVKKQ